MMEEFSLGEQVVVEIARSFKPENNFVTQAVSISGLVALALAKRLYAPNIHIVGQAKGNSALLHDVSFTFPFEFGMDSTPPQFVESVIGMSEIFDYVVKGKWCILMQPAQIDLYGNANTLLVGDKRKPKRWFIGPRGLPCNTVNAPSTFYLINNHNPRVFVEKVDFVCGVGYCQAREDGLIKWGGVSRVFTNFGVFDFDEKTRRMRIKSIHDGVTMQQVIDNTGFQLVVPENLSMTRPPTEEELTLLRTHIDPLGLSKMDFPEK
jgi:acyl CoA:acetate/3-ketoacid CoA transferase beta subunit